MREGKAGPSEGDAPQRRRWQTPRVIESNIGDTDAKIVAANESLNSTFTITS